jgi:cytochrome b561
LDNGGLVPALLLIGIGIISSLSEYHWRVSIHRPLGVSILVLVVIRLLNRLLNTAPAYPEHTGWQRFAAHASHVVLYGLMFASPLVGWGMLGGALSDRALGTARTAAYPTA